MTTARVVGAVLAVVMTVGTAWMSRLPIDFGRDAESLLRLSWRVDGVTVEACRTLSEEELANLPVHMRNPEACIGTIAPFTLSAVLDGESVVADTVFPGGARGDRPIYVLRDLPLSPGRRTLEVRFNAVIPDGADVEGATTGYVWEGVVELEAGDIALLTLDDRGEFTLRTPRLQ